MATRHVIKTRHEEGRVFISTVLEMTEEEFSKFKEQSNGEIMSVETAINDMKAELVKLDAGEKPNDSFIEQLKEGLEALQKQQKAEQLRQKIIEAESSIEIGRDNIKNLK